MCIRDRFLGLLAAGQPVSMAVVGGSISAGATYTTLRGEKASWLWHRLFFDWLNATFPHRANSQFNGALPASTPGYVESCITLHVPVASDLVFVEYAANFDNPRAYERLLRRLLRYRPGDRFESHFDREVPTDCGRHRSLVTVLLYLNDADDFEGGATLYEDTTDAKRFAAVAPARGRVVLFEHDLWHSGAPVTAGTKLVLRTDVLFDAAAPKPPPAPAQSRDRAKGVRGLADAVAPDLADALDAIGLLDCGVEALIAAGREAYAAMLADAPDAQVDRLWAAAVAEASALPVAPANTRAVVT